MSDRQSDAPALRLVFWETTAGCNLECIHCRRLDVSKAMMASDLSTQRGMTLIDEIAEVGRPILVFSGGEPLIRPDLFELADHAKRRGLLTALATNGTMVDDRLARRIAGTGFDRVSVSLDGADAVTHDSFRALKGAFDRALEALEHLRSAGVPTQVNCTIAKHNQHQLDALRALAERVGAVALHYFLLVPVGCGEQIAESQMLSGEEVEARLHEVFAIEQATALQIKATCAPHYYRVVRQERAAQRARGENVAEPSAHPGGHPGGRPAGHVSGASGGHPSSAGGAHPGGAGALHSVTRGCLAGTAVCFVSHDGEVFPCGYMAVSAGNIRQQTFGEVWRSSSVFAQLRDPNLLTGKCGACSFRQVCGGCRARAFYQYGDYLAEEPFCTYQPEP